MCCSQVLAQSAETVIFMFLGLSTISAPHNWDTAFIASTVLLCILCRTLGVVLQCALLNKFRGKKFTMVSRSYSGHPHQVSS